MNTSVLDPSHKDKLATYIQHHPDAQLITFYLYYISLRDNVQPVVFAPELQIYKSEEHLLSLLEKENKLYNETVVKLTAQESVNERTKKIYICPFTGKVFGDNTHPNPQDAIYDWVSKCPENKERVKGLKVKRFYVSDDPDMIKEYFDKQQSDTDGPLTKTVYSSVSTGKLFATKNNAIKDLKTTGLKAISLDAIPEQNRYEIDPSFLEEIQEWLSESNLQSFLEKLSEYEEFEQAIEQWIGSQQD